MARQESWLTLASRSFWIWFGGIWLLVGLSFLIGTCLMLGTLQELRRGGAEADGVVLDKWIEEQAGSTPKIRYRFIAPDGQGYEGESELARQDWEAAREGDAVRLRYHPKWPILNQRKGEEPRAGRILAFLGIGALLTAIGGFLVVSWLAKLRRFVYLQEHGMLVEGTVVDVTPTGIIVNHERLHALRYQYRDHRGATREGKSRALAPEEALKWHPGDRGSVRYDRLRPSISEWMGTRWGEA